MWISGETSIFPGQMQYMNIMPFVPHCGLRSELKEETDKENSAEKQSEKTDRMQVYFDGERLY